MRPSLVCGVLAGVLLLGGCGSATEPEASSFEAIVVEDVTSGSSTFLVARDVGGTMTTYKVQTLPNTQFWRVKDGEVSRDASFSDLRKGYWVEVRTTGGERLSMPPVVEATRVLMEPRCVAWPNALGCVLN